jgi:hypothetical protein
METGEVIGWLLLLTWPAPTAYAFYRKLDYRWCVPMANFWMLIFPPFLGPFIQLWSLHNRVRKEELARMRAIEQLRQWKSEKTNFLSDYSELELDWANSGVNRLSEDERDRKFFAMYPDAKLHSGPENAYDFEYIAACWMKYWGIFDARVTQASGDGGIDVLSSRFAAQVKFYSNAKVGRPEIQQLFGAAHGRKLDPLFFAYSSGYTTEALEWATAVGVGCFTFMPRADRRGFKFEANTPTAAELMLENEGIDYEEHQYRTQMEDRARNYRRSDLKFRDFYVNPVRFDIYRNMFDLRGFVGIFSRKKTS